MATEKPEVLKAIRASITPDELQQIFDSAIEQVEEWPEWMKRLRKMERF